MMQQKVTSSCCAALTLALVAFVVVPDVVRGQVAPMATLGCEECENDVRFWPYPGTIHRMGSGGGLFACGIVNDPPCHGNWEWFSCDESHARCWAAAVPVDELEDAVGTADKDRLRALLIKHREAFAYDSHRQVITIRDCDGSVREEVTVPSQLEDLVTAEIADGTQE